MRKGEDEGDSDSSHLTISVSISEWQSCFWMKSCIYYSTVLVVVQKTHETSTNIPRYCTVSYLYTWLLYSREPVWLVWLLTLPRTHKSLTRYRLCTIHLQKNVIEKSWIINSLLDVLVCSIAEYLYSLFVFWRCGLWVKGRSDPRI